MARKTIQSPAETRRNILNRKYPPCPFCGEIPKYPAHKNFCEKNPDAKSNREKVVSQAKKDYVDNGIMAKVQAGNVKNRDRLVANAYKTHEKLRAKGFKPKGNTTQRRHTEETKAKISAAKTESWKNRPVTLAELQKSLARDNVVMPVIDDSRRILDDHPFFRETKKLPDSEGWIEVDPWSIDDL